MTDTINISQKRSMILFSYNSIYGFFRSKEKSEHPDESCYFDLFYLGFHHNSSPEDCLIDITLAIRSGKLSLQVNDIVVLKINGQQFSYKYVEKISGILTGCNSFVFTPGFLNKEISLYIDLIHKNNKVLSIMDGQLFSTTDKLFCNKRVYCIENDSYSHKAGYINTIFSLYELVGRSICNLNPCGRPFISLQNVFYFLKGRQKKSDKLLLLYNRKELEMIKDNNQLSKIELMI